MGNCASVLTLPVQDRSHKVYHITKKENLQSIKENGLIAQRGANCKRVSDPSSGVFFTDYKAGAIEWIQRIYGIDADLENFIVIEFDLIDRKWNYHNRRTGDLFCYSDVKPTDLTFYTAKDFLKNIS